MKPPLIDTAVSQQGQQFPRIRGADSCVKRRRPSPASDARDRQDRWPVEILARRRNTVSGRTADHTGMVAKR